MVSTVLLVAPASAAESSDFKFPWDASKTLAFTGGPHIWDGEPGSGLDFSDGSKSTPILAMANGEVLSVGDEICKFGKCKTAKVKHDNGWEIWYVHLSDYAPKLDKGVRVQQGDWIGNEGATGANGVTHIHIELRKDGRGISWTNVTIEGWSSHTDCKGYEKDKNTVQNKAPCLAQDYDGYLSKGTTQITPQTGGGSYSKYQMASTNHARPRSYLTELPRVPALKPGEIGTTSITLENIGPIDWIADGQFSLKLVSGEALHLTSPTLLRQAVPRGGQMTLESEVTAPEQIGLRDGIWQLAYNDTPFGDRFPISVVVAPKGSDAGFVSGLQTLIEDARAKLLETYREGWDKFQAKWEDLKRQAEERAKEEARREAERQIRGICGAPIGLVLVGGLVSWRRWRGRRPR